MKNRKISRVGDRGARGGIQNLGAVSQPKVDGLRIHSQLSTKGPQPAGAILLGNDTKWATSFFAARSSLLDRLYAKCHQSPDRPQIDSARRLVAPKHNEGGSLMKAGAKTDPPNSRKSLIIKCDAQQLQQLQLFHSFFFFPKTCGLWTVDLWAPPGGVSANCAKLWTVDWPAGPKPRSEGWWTSGSN